jgi:hypothetical protein
VGVIGQRTSSHCPARHRVTGQRHGAAGAGARRRSRRPVPLDASEPWGFPWKPLDHSRLVLRSLMPAVAWSLALAGAGGAEGT